MRTQTTSIELSGATNLAVLAPIKQGFVDGFETISYVSRLHKLLTALNASRVAAREASLTRPVFADAIGRFGIIQNFRYAIFPPYAEGGAGAADPFAPPVARWLTLNITFDGGWEPYMRVIYRDIGTLLDALFCNCEGYRGSRTSSFDDYCRWVRANELPSGLFYTDSSMSVGDQHYLAQVERLQREARDPADADREIAGFATDSDRVRDQKALAVAMANPPVAVSAALRSIKGIYRLSPFYPPNAADESGILVRFAQQVLREFHALYRKIGRGEMPAPEGFELLTAQFSAELAWFDQNQPRVLPEDPTPYSKDRLQAGIVESYAGITHGCLVFLRVEPADRARAAEFLASYPVTGQGVPDQPAIRRNIAFTHAGLRALGVHAQRLDKLPPEFTQGMEARAGLLGDIRTNHPDNWKRPPRNWSADGMHGGEPIDLSTVHVVITLRMSCDRTDASAGLHDGLDVVIKELQRDTVGVLTVLGVQALRSYVDPDAANPREHFGFLDGFSQPRVLKNEPGAPRPVDAVVPGEFVLGYCNSRGDGAELGAGGELLQDGSFLVVRKLRQNLDALHDALDKADDGAMPSEATKNEVLERMMGRRMDGTPMVENGDSKSNDFDYRGDPNGARCPFHAHVRRANPRDGRPAMPRIIRRGMSYGARSTGPADRGDDRGIVFMAYCASIAEQFEVIQRWIAGGNSSGVSASQADPFLAVPERGDRRTLRFLQQDNRVRRIELGDKPFVSLQWGLYLFVPSLAALRLLPRLLEPPVEPASSGEEPARAPDEIEQWRRRLEDPELSRALWKHVRDEYGGKLDTPYGQLIGSAAAVLDVLKDKGERFSVCGYGARMDSSIGRGYLGLDPHQGHDVQSHGVNAEIAKYDPEKAFKDARPIVDTVIGRFKALAAMAPDGSGRVPIDLLSMSERVLAALCAQWFGLPDEPAAGGLSDRGRATPALMVSGGRSSDDTDPPRCPGHLFTTSRYLFLPRPSDAVKTEGEAQGKRVLRAVEQLLDLGRPLGELAGKIRDRLLADAEIPEKDRGALVAPTIAGVMLGFPPTVHGNFMRILGAWLKSGDLWALQQRLLEGKATPADAFQRARSTLFDPMVTTMGKNPVPEMIWRTRTGSKVADPKRPEGNDLVVLGLASAMLDPAADDHYLMFGGEFGRTVHACPGYGMAMGVLLALTSGLFEAGTLRPTGSPIGLTLIPNAN